MSLSRVPLEARRREIPLKKESSHPSWFTTSPKSKLGDWIIQQLSPLELGEKYIESLQIETYIQISHLKSTSRSVELGVSSDLEKEFNERADRWEKQTGIYSSPTKRFLHEDYQTIMTMGEPVIPLILKRLQTKPDDWFWALKHFARKDAAIGKDNFKDAVEAWLEWGLESGYIKSK